MRVAAKVINGAAAKIPQQMIRRAGVYLIPTFLT
jgi:hypothetical protein